MNLYWVVYLFVYRICRDFVVHGGSGFRFWSKHREISYQHVFTTKKFNYNKMLDFFFLPICYSSLLDWTFESRFFVESAPSARIIYSISDLSLFIGCNAISLEYKNSYHSDCVDVLLCFFCYLFICSIVVVMSLSFQVTYLRSVIITAFCLSKSAWK